MFIYLTKRFSIKSRVGLIVKIVKVKSLVVHVSLIELLRKRIIYIVQRLH